jgi:thiosulfate/3-mercaptopyruvate sulfurtransferase
MEKSTVVSTAEVAGHLDDSQWAIVDCRFSLGDTGRGRRDYDRAHIPGAVYAHLDEDLSGIIKAGITGRHPLPEPETFARTLGDWGIGSGVQVVAYDDAGGAFASRLWWMLGWLGHDSVAVLDGGWPLWVQEGRPVREGPESRPLHNLEPRPRAEWVVDSDAVAAGLNDPDQLLFDSRSADRYRGENETIDPVAGHIPGAVSAPYLDNLDANGLFRSKEELGARFESLLAGKPAGEAVFYCGSGVSAAHNLLAMAHSGMEPARLYAGSWSEWITNPSRPIIGPQPE